MLSFHSHSDPLCIDCPLPLFRKKVNCLREEIEGEKNCDTEKGKSKCGGVRTVISAGYRNKICGAAA